MATPGRHAPLSTHALPLGVALAYGAFVFATLPPEVIAVNDDFGYLRSVVATIGRGRPWTDAWLEPWAASLSALSALIFEVTGSMRAATSGLQAACAAAAVAGAFALFRLRDVPRAASAALAVVLVSSPTLLWKSLEYTGVALYLPCLVWAMWAAAKRRWGLFFVVWLVAVASRQSAVSWLALPAWASLEAVLRDRRAATRWITSALVLPGAAIALVALSRLMNKTHAQTMITDHLWERLNLAASLPHAGVAGATLLAFAGLGALVVRVPGPSAGTDRRRFWRPWAVVLTAALCVWYLRWGGVVQLEHDSYARSWGHLYIGLAAILAVAGWTMSRVPLHTGFLLAAIASLILVALRPAIWDYYLMDVALFALFVPAAPAARQPAARQPSRWRGPALAAPIAVAAAFHLHFAFDLKLVFDRSYAACVLAEQALRRGRIGPADLAFAPFGYAGWHLYPYFIANEGRNDRDIGGFVRYLKPYPVVLRPDAPVFWREPAAVPSAAGTDAPDALASAVIRVGWLWRQRFVLVRRPEADRMPAALPIDAARYRLSPFPLSGREWREAIPR